MQTIQIRKFNSSILCFEKLKKKKNGLKHCRSFISRYKYLSFFSIFFQKRNELFSNISVD